jgi:hypothetical protein
VKGRIQKMEQELAEIPQIKRGRVWCRTCRRTQKVNGMECLRSGWPMCCGHTMTIDSPAEQAKPRTQA